MDLENETEHNELDEEQEVERPNDDIRSMVQAAFEGAVSPEHEAEGEESASESNRDEKGRFSKQIDSDLETVKPVEAQEEPIDPPYSWSADEKERFQQLPRELKQYLSKREQEREAFISRKSQESEQVRRRFEPVDRIFNEYGEVFRKANVDPVVGVEQLRVPVPAPAAVGVEPEVLLEAGVVPGPVAVGLVRGDGVGRLVE